MVICQNNTKLSVDLFNPPKEAVSIRTHSYRINLTFVVNPWLVPIIRELEMPCIVTFVPIESVPDRLIDGFKGELAGVTTITRVDDVVAGGGGLVAGGDVVDDTGGDVVVDAVGGADVVGGVVQPVDVVVGGGGVGDDVPASIVGEKLRDDDADIGGFTPVAGFSGVGGFGGNFSGGGLSGRRFADVGAGTSKVPSCACECTTCKEKMDNLIRKVEELVQAQEATNTSIQRLISKRGINPSKNLSSPYTPVHVRRRGKAIAKALASVRSRKPAATPSKSIETPLLDVGPKVLKKVDIFKPVHAQRKKKVETAIKAKKSRKTMYSMHEFRAPDFKALTSMEIWWEDYLSFNTSIYLSTSVCCCNRSFILLNLLQQVN
ncbi:uncharacterized protein LOC132042571 [Lycium ferocissimum]|uniref:uncharacterized protein LOC132042571 n=1 Tax=Lycium ferocissimum TaxID=112874 RepID=UPI002815907F|nr:uncharacterized protein LOC132042571 [Lycium ferocissimum]